MKLWRVLIILALLLIPATCAQASGPHSIFTDPAAMAAHHANHHADEAVAMTQAELELHVLLGHMTSSGRVLVDEAVMETEQIEAAAVASDDDASDPCLQGPRLKDLPSTMAMAALMTPITIDPVEELALPESDEPVFAAPPCVLLAAASWPESPPPRA